MKEVYVIFKFSSPIAQSCSLRLAKDAASAMHATAIVMYTFSGSITKMEMVPVKAWRHFEYGDTRWNECMLISVGINS